MWDEHNTRKPMLSLRLSWLFSLRADERAREGSLFQDPPRTTRATSQGAPQSSTLQTHYHSEPRDLQKKSSAAARRCQ